MTDFASAFSDELRAYLTDKVSHGYQKKSFVSHLNKFDQFCSEHSLSTSGFTRTMADQWIERRENEASTTHYSRVNCVKGFLTYLSKKGYAVFITLDVPFKNTSFQPHIYSTEETRRYFEAVDAFTSGNRKNQIQYPVLFRLLYCCGTRINETLGIRRRNVDLDLGILKLLETKNTIVRYIVLGDDMLALMKQFAYRSFYLLRDDDYIFSQFNGRRLHRETVFKHHQLFLKDAGIPYVGGAYGPRLQDWRHTFAVNSFKKMIDSGMDLYVALPILSTYLGHKTIYATERYVRLTMNIFPYINRKLEKKMTLVFGKGNHENH